MSKEDVGLTRQYVEAFNRGGLDATEHLRHPEIEVFDPSDLPDVGHVYAFQDGKARRIRQYLTRSEALEAAGLSE